MAEGIPNLLIITNSRFDNALVKRELARQRINFEQTANGMKIYKLSIKQKRGKEHPTTFFLDMLNFTNLALGKVKNFIFICYVR